ncbi:MAG TPA: hypothetical protein VNO26_13975 [Candidatus Limnocylindria bacterium]|nr:hypothetical protein [Candidatus Limnocylindria bacterium]
MLDYPAWLQLWIAWMGLVNLASVGFLRHVQARWVLGAFLAAGALMNLLYATNGFNRLLGLGHVVFWTPLVVYLWRQRPELQPGPLRAWLSAVLATNTTSLLVDYADVARYLLGDRG